MTLTRRFYKQVGVRQVENGYAIALDGRALKTPHGNSFAAPTLALAEAMAMEWESQGDMIAPLSMPITQLAFASIDVTPGRRDELSAGLSKYVEADLVCHRAESPPALVARQAAHWDPIVAWAQERFHMILPVVIGVIAADIGPERRTVFAWEIDDLDDFRCTALAQATTLTGSLLIGFALLEGRLDAAAAFEAAALDNLWSMQCWGEDAEARAGLDRLERDLGAVGRFVAALGD